MTWNEQLPEWNNTGSEPAQQKKDDGWAVDERPPAGWWNWLLNRAYKALQEIRSRIESAESGLAGKADQVDFTAHSGNTSNPHTVTKAQVGLGNVDDVQQMPIAGGTFAGPVDHNSNELRRPRLRTYSEIVAVSSGSGTKAFNVSNGNIFKHTMTGDITVAFTAPGESGPCYTIVLILKMHTSTKTITWPASVKWVEDWVPNAPNPNLLATYVFYTLNNGVSWQGFQAGNNQSE